MRKGTIILISFLLGLILVGGYILYDNYKNTQASTTTYYSITLFSEDKEKGTVENLEEKEYKAGEKIVLRAMPSEDYSFSGWYIEDKLLSTQNPYTYEVKEEVTIVAKFLAKEDPEEPEVPATYTVTLTAGEGGSVTPLTQTTYEAGAEIVLAATANEGYTFSGFYENSTLISSENPHTYTVTKDVTITAIFAIADKYVTNLEDYQIIGSTIMSYTGDDEYIRIPSSYTPKEIETYTLNSFEDYFTFVSNLDFEIRESMTIIVNDEEYSVDDLMMAPDVMDSLTYPYEMQYKLAEFGSSINITKIGNSAFANGTFKEVIIPEGIVSIGEQSFSECPNLEVLEVPASVTSLGGSASTSFSKCPKLKLTINENNTSYFVDENKEFAYTIDGKKLIWYDESLTHIVINPTVEQFCVSFQDNTVVEYIEYLGTVGNYNGYPIPRGCTNLKVLKVAKVYNSIQVINYFRGCASLETIYSTVEWGGNLVTQEDIIEDLKEATGNDVQFILIDSEGNPIE